MADTCLRPHPGMRRMLTSDDVGSFMRYSEVQRAMRHLKFPTVRGTNYDFPSFQARNRNSPAFVKWNRNSSAPHSGYSLAPHRDNHPVVDPTSGLVSAGKDADDGETTAGSIVKLATQSDKVSSKEVDSETRPQTPTHPNPPWNEQFNGDNVESRWNSRKKSEIAIRASFGGWTSDEKVEFEKKEEDSLRTGDFNFNPDNENDQIAKNYVYRSTTQKNYEAIDWDEKITRKIRPCTTTKEKRSDRVTMQLNVFPKRYEASPDIYQKLGASWDKVQTRRPLDRTKADFKSHFSRVNQIPGYQGCTGAYNIEEKDNCNVKVRPFTTMRSVKPRPPVNAGRVDVPGYTGRHHWLSAISPNQSHALHSRSVSASTYRAITRRPQYSIWSRQGPFSKMVTTVAPNNPFNKIDPDDKLVE